MSTDRALSHFEAHKAAYLNDLETLVRIPSVSFPGFDPAHVRKSAEAVASLLKERGFSFHTEPGDQVREVRVKKLRLAVMGHRGATLDFNAGHIRYGNNVYDFMEPALRGYRMPLANVNVDVATIQMVFAWPSGPRTLTFDLWPDSCNLRDAPEHLVAKRCLRRWELACA